MNKGALIYFMSGEGPLELGPIIKGVAKIVAQVIEGRVVSFRYDNCIPMIRSSSRKTRKITILTPGYRVLPYIIEGEKGGSTEDLYNSLGEINEEAYTSEQVLKFLLDYPQVLESGMKNAFRVIHKNKEFLVVMWKDDNGQVLGEKHDFFSLRIWTPENKLVFWIAKKA